MKILRVDIIAANTVNPTWKGELQKVVTDKGVFLDNMPSENYNWNGSEEGSKLGFPWKVGYVEGGYTIVQARQTWLKKITGNPTLFQDTVQD